jgi:16S rRNA (uracil1498-N3)-methyltransferase
MHRLYVAPEQLGEGEVLLQPEQTHYLRDVLRLQPGAALEVFDGLGGRWRAVLVAPGAVELGEKLLPRARAIDVIIAQALVKGEKMDLIVQKCTELGASRIVPIAAERSVIKLDEARGREKAARWQKIAQEAARQSGRDDVPEVDPPLPFEALIEVARGRTALVLDPLAQVRLSARAQDVDRLLLAVGPEGGFSESELERAAAARFTRVGLGPLVLRTETAALAALAVIQHLNGELG